MTASLVRTLASALDSAVANGSYVRETSDAIIVSEVPAAVVRLLQRGFEEIGWALSIVDSAETETVIADVTDDFGPYRLTGEKPTQANGQVLLLTESGLADWLSNADDVEIVMVAGLSQPIITESTAFVPADDRSRDHHGGPAIRSPRTLVREYGTHRITPKTIGRWLLRDASLWDPTNRKFRVWANASIKALLLSVCNEIDPDNGNAIFKGPPRFTVPISTVNGDVIEALRSDGFRNLQDAGKWVYEIDREAETRHTILATEIARTGGSQTLSIHELGVILGYSLEGAKIAFQMSLSKISADNLKALADLRKAVTDETGKITDATRQVVAAVASAVAIGIGLIAARVAANAPGLLIATVMLVVVAYISSIIYSGYHFNNLQRRLRDVWRGQLYRFLSAEEYNKLVVEPGNEAGRIFRFVSWVGGIAVGITFIAALVVAAIPARNTIDNQASSNRASQAGTETTQSPSN